MNLLCETTVMPFTVTVQLCQWPIKVMSFRRVSSITIVISV